MNARVALGGFRDKLDEWREAGKESEALYSRIGSGTERAGTFETSPAKLTAPIMAANELVDIHELRLAAVENFLPASLLFLLIGVAGVSV